MSVYKDATRNSWYVKIRYIDYYGKKKQTTKQIQAQMKVHQMRT